MRDKNRVNKTVVKKIIGYCENVEELIKRFGPDYEKFVSDFAFQMACFDKGNSRLKRKIAKNFGGDDLIATWKN